MPYQTGKGFPADVWHRRRGGRSGGSSGPAGGSYGGGSMVAPNYVVGPPTVERPPQASDFFSTSVLAGLTNANTPVAFPDTVQIPPNNVAVIRSVSILANNLLITSDIRWTLFYNGVSVPGWNALSIAPRAAGSIEVSFTPEETFVPVPEGAVISWGVTVVDAGTYQVSVTTHGWFYPSTIQALARNAYG